MKKKILVSALLLAIGFGSAWANEPTLYVQPLLAYVHPTPTVHNILSGELILMALRTAIKKDYKDYWITDLYETVGKKESVLFYHFAERRSDHIMNATDSENWVVTGTTAIGV